MGVRPEKLVYIARYDIVMAGFLIGFVTGLCLANVVYMPQLTTCRQNNDCRNHTTDYTNQTTHTPPAERIAYHVCDCSRCPVMNCSPCVCQQCRVVKCLPCECPVTTSAEQHQITNSEWVYIQSPDTQVRSGVVCRFRVSTTYGSYAYQGFTYDQLCSMTTLWTLEDKIVKNRPECERLSVSREYAFYRYYTHLLTGKNFCEMFTNIGHHWWGKNIVRAPGDDHAKNEPTKVNSIHNNKDTKLYVPWDIVTTSISTCGFKKSSYLYSDGKFGEFHLRTLCLSTKLFHSMVSSVSLSACQDSIGLAPGYAFYRHTPKWTRPDGKVIERCEGFRPSSFKAAPSKHWVP